MTITPSMQVKIRRSSFNEADHPRDRVGRFIETGAEVRIWGGGSGRVERNVGNGRIEVLRADGKRVIVHRNYLTVTARPNGEAPTTNEAEAGTIAVRQPSRAAVDDPDVDPEAAVAPIDGIAENAAILTDPRESLLDESTIADLDRASRAYTTAATNEIDGDEADARADLLRVLDEADETLDGYLDEDGDVEAQRAAAAAIRATAEAEPEETFPGMGGREGNQRPDRGDAPDLLVEQIVPAEQDYTDADGEPFTVAVGDYAVGPSGIEGWITGFTESGGPIVRTTDGQDWPYLPDADLRVTAQTDFRAQRRQPMPIEWWGAEAGEDVKPADLAEGDRVFLPGQGPVTVTDSSGRWIEWEDAAGVVGTTEVRASDRIRRLPAVEAPVDAAASPEAPADGLGEPETISSQRLARGEAEPLPDGARISVDGRLATVEQTRMGISVIFDGDERRTVIATGPADTVEVQRVAEDAKGVYSGSDAGESDPGAETGSTDAMTTKPERITTADVQVGDRILTNGGIEHVVTSITDQRGRAIDRSGAMPGRVVVAGVDDDGNVHQWTYTSGSRLRRVGQGEQVEAPARPVTRTRAADLQPGDRLMLDNIGDVVVVDVLSGEGNTGQSSRIFYTTPADGELASTQIVTNRQYANVTGSGQEVDERAAAIVSAAIARYDRNNDYIEEVVRAETASYDAGTSAAPEPTPDATETPAPEPEAPDAQPEGDAPDRSVLDGATRGDQVTISFPASAEGGGGENVLTMGSDGRWHLGTIDFEGRDSDALWEAFLAAREKRPGTSIRRGFDSSPFSRGGTLPGGRSDSTEPGVDAWEPSEALVRNAEALRGISDDSLRRARATYVEGGDAPVGPEAAAYMLAAVDAEIERRATALDDARNALPEHLTADPSTFPEPTDTTTAMPTWSVEDMFSVNGPTIVVTSADGTEVDRRPAAEGATPGEARREAARSAAAYGASQGIVAPAAPFANVNDLRDYLLRGGGNIEGLAGRREMATLPDARLAVAGSTIAIRQKGSSDWTIYRAEGGSILGTRIEVTKGSKRDIQGLIAQVDADLDGFEASRVNEWRSPQGETLGEYVVRTGVEFNAARGLDPSPIVVAEWRRRETQPDRAASEEGQAWADEIRVGDAIDNRDDGSDVVTAVSEVAPGIFEVTYDGKPTPDRLKRNDLVRITARAEPEPVEPEPEPEPVVDPEPVDPEPVGLPDRTPQTFSDAVGDSASLSDLTEVATSDDGQFYRIDWDDDLVAAYPDAAFPGNPAQGQPFRIRSVRVTPENQVPTGAEGIQTRVVTWETDTRWGQFVLPADVRVTPVATPSPEPEVPDAEAALRQRAVAALADDGVPQFGSERGPRDVGGVALASLVGVDDEVARRYVVDGDSMTGDDYRYLAAQFEAGADLTPADAESYEWLAETMYSRAADADERVAVDVDLNDLDDAMHPAAAIANSDPESVQIDYSRNPTSSTASATNQDFGQAIEPAGRYLVDSQGAPAPEGWGSGTVVFRQPLNLDFGGGYDDDSNWKRRLSAHYGGLTGSALSDAVRADGYDAIVTSDAYGRSEIVDLSDGAAEVVEEPEVVTPTPDPEPAQPNPPAPTPSGDEVTAADVQVDDVIDFAGPRRIVRVETEGDPLGRGRVRLVWDGGDEWFMPGESFSRAEPATGRPAPVVIDPPAPGIPDPDVAGPTDLTVASRVASDLEPGDQVIVDGEALTITGIEDDGDRRTLDYFDATGAIGSYDVDRSTVLDAVASDEPILPEPSPEMDRAEAISGRDDQALASTLAEGDEVWLGNRKAVVVGVADDGDPDTVSVTYRFPGERPETTPFGRAVVLDRASGEFLPDPEPLPAGTRTSRPVLYTYQRRNIVALGLDLDADPTVAEAARRLRTRQPLTAEQSAAMAARLVEMANAPGVRAQRQRMLLRLAAANNAAAIEAGSAGVDVPSLPNADRAVRSRIADTGLGDHIAFVRGGSVITGVVTGQRAMMGGRLVEVEYTTPDGSTVRTLLTARTETYVIPDLPEPTPVRGPDRPEMVRRENLRVGDRVYRPTSLGSDEAAGSNSVTITAISVDDEGYFEIETDSTVSFEAWDGPRTQAVSLAGRGFESLIRLSRGAESADQPRDADMPDLSPATLPIGEVQVGDWVRIPDDYTGGSRFNSPAGREGVVIETTAVLDEEGVRVGTSITISDMEGRSDKVVTFDDDGTQVTRLIERDLNTVTQIAEAKRRQKEHMAALGAATAIYRAVDGHMSATATALQETAARTSWDDASEGTLESFRPPTRDLGALRTEVLAQLGIAFDERPAYSAQVFDAVEQALTNRREAVVSAIMNAEPTTAEETRDEARRRMAQAYIDGSVSDDGEYTMEVAVGLVRLREAIRSSGVRATERPAAPQGEWSSIVDRMGAYRAALPAVFGTTEVERSTVASVDVEALRRGEPPALETVRTAARLKAADGGPSADAMGQVEVLRAAGNDLSVEIERRLDASIAEVYGTNDEAAIAAAAKEAADAGYEAYRAALAASEVEYAAARERWARSKGFESYEEITSIRLGKIEVTTERREEAADAAITFLGEIRGGNLQKIRAIDPALADAQSRVLDAQVQWKTLDQRWSEARQARALRRREVTLEVLGEIRDFGGKRLNYLGRGRTSSTGKPLDNREYETAMRFAEQHYPTEWLERLSKRPPLTIGGIKRGHFDQRNWEIRLSADGSMERPGVPPRGRVATHELGHAMEFVVPGISAAEEGLMWARTSEGEVGERRRARTGWVDKSPVYQDDFPDEYTGKDYGDGQFYEIFTTGMESLFAGSEYLDDDFRAWLLGTLALV